MTKQKTPKPAPKATLPSWLMKTLKWWNRLSLGAKYLIVGIFGVFIGVVILNIFGPCLGCEYQKLPQGFQIQLIYSSGGFGGLVIAIIIALVTRKAAPNKILFMGLGLLLTLFFYLLWISTSEGGNYARPQCTPNPTLTSTFTPTFTPTTTETPAPTSTITPTPTPDCGGIQVSQLKLNLATGFNQIRVLDDNNGIILKPEEIDTLAMLSGEAIRTNTKGAQCLCNWEGKTNMTSAWEPADGKIGCGFSIEIKDQVDAIYLMLFINGQEYGLFTIKVQ